MEARNQARCSAIRRFPPGGPCGRDRQKFGGNQHRPTTLSSRTNPRQGGEAEGERKKNGRNRRRSVAIGFWSLPETTCSDSPHGRGLCRAIPRAAGTFQTCGEGAVDARPPGRGIDASC